jgi:hypothetical protein
MHLRVEESERELKPFPTRLDALMLLLTVLQRQKHCFAVFLAQEKHVPRLHSIHCFQLVTVDYTFQLFARYFLKTGNCIKLLHSCIF